MQNGHLYELFRWLYQKHGFFFNENADFQLSKVHSNFAILFWKRILKGTKFRNFTYSEDISKTWNSKTRQTYKILRVMQITVYSIFLCPPTYCVHQNTVSTLAFNIIVQLSLVAMVRPYHTSPCVSVYKCIILLLNC